MSGQLSEFPDNWTMLELNFPENSGQLGSTGLIRAVWAPAWRQSGSGAQEQRRRAWTLAWAKSKAFKSSAGLPASGPACG